MTEAALSRCIALAIERIESGSPLSAKLATDVKRLAKAAGVDFQATAQPLVATALRSPVVWKAPQAFWSGFRTPIVALATTSREVRDALFAPTPDIPTARWLPLLEASGVADEMRAGERGALDWIRRFIHKESDRWRQHFPAELTWPVLEDAAQQLGGNDPAEVTIHESWPWFGVAARNRIVWVTADTSTGPVTVTPPVHSHHDNWQWFRVGGDTLCLSWAPEQGAHMTWASSPGTHHDVPHLLGGDPRHISFETASGRLPGPGLIRPGDSQLRLLHRELMLQEDDAHWCARHPTMRSIAPGTGKLGSECLYKGPVLRCRGAEGSTWEQENTTGDRRITPAARLRRPEGGQWLVTPTGHLTRESCQQLLPAWSRHGNDHLLHRLPVAGWHFLRPRDEAASTRRNRRSSLRRWLRQQDGCS